MEGFLPSCRARCSVQATALVFVLGSWCACSAPRGADGVPLPGEGGPTSSAAGSTVPHDPPERMQEHGLPEIPRGALTTEIPAGFDRSVEWERRLGADRAWLGPDGGTIVVSVDDGTSPGAAEVERMPESMRGMFRPTFLRFETAQVERAVDALDARLGRRSEVRLPEAADRLLAQVVGVVSDGGAVREWFAGTDASVEDVLRAPVEAGTYGFLSFDPRAVEDDAFGGPPFVLIEVRAADGGTVASLLQGLHDAVLARFGSGIEIDGSLGDARRGPEAFDLLPYLRYLPESRCVHYAWVSLTDSRGYRAALDLPRFMWSWDVSRGFESADAMHAWARVDAADDRDLLTSLADDWDRILVARDEVVLVFDDGVEEVRRRVRAPADNGFPAGWLLFELSRTVGPMLREAETGHVYLDVLSWSPDEENALYVTLGS